MAGINRLPDCYRKDKGSNNYKLLEINRSAADELREDIQSVCHMLDLNLATGKTLELYGDMLLQKRGALNDVQYRYILLAKIGRNMVQGDYASVISAIALMFNCTEGDITLDDADTGELACVVKLTRFPISVLVSAGFSSRQAVQMISKLLPVCVTLSVDSFEGTFEFADSADEYDIYASFGDLNGTIGGYLGLLLGDDDLIPVLPI